MARIWSDLKIDVEANTGQSPTFFRILKHVVLHPSVRVLFNYRIYRMLGDKNPFSRLFWASNAFKSGCFLSPYATIEPGVILVHASGIVIGEGSTVKKGARIFQHVTVGTKNWTENQTNAHIEENAVLYAGAVVAGSHKVGQGAVVGANAVVLSDIPDGCCYAGSPAKNIKAPA